jgi:hypothetical protein
MANQFVPLSKTKKLVSLRKPNCKLTIIPDMFVILYVQIELTLKNKRANKTVRFFNELSAKKFVYGMPKGT